MTTMRTYRDPCGIARALDLVGERWALLVVRELLLGPKRFTDLRSGLPQLSADVLSQRLRELEQAGVVGRRRLSPPASARVYELTDRGRELESLVIQLGRWGSREPLPAVHGELSPDASMLALKTLFEPSAAEGLTGSYELRIGDDRFSAAVADGRLELVRGSAAEPHAVVTTDTATLSAVLWHGRGLDDALKSGDLALEGSKTALKRFLRLFPLRQLPSATPAR
jgi:DNA-binding HxlR family transcriptional regulator